MSEDCIGNHPSDQLPEKLEVAIRQFRVVLNNLKESFQPGKSIIACYVYLIVERELDGFLKSQVSWKKRRA